MRIRVYQPDFEKGNGLVPVIVVEKRSKKVLMLAYANKEAFTLTLRTGFAHYYSRSRQTLWKKGETSNSLQVVSDILTDCDGDALIYVVDQGGSGACHTGAKSCFYRSCMNARQLESAPQAGLKECLQVEYMTVFDQLPSLS